MIGNRAGFVLAGGRSTRMGRDKALLPWGGRTLLEHIAGQVVQAAGSVTVIGPPERYQHLGLPTLPDLHPGCGPLAGVETALASTEAEWNLIVACDLPFLDAAFFHRLFQLARKPAVVPVSPRGPEPLCAVYHCSCHLAAAEAITANGLKMQDFIAKIGAHLETIEGNFESNLNTPEDLAHYGSSAALY